MFLDKKPSRVKSFGDQCSVTKLVSVLCGTNLYLRTNPIHHRKLDQKDSLGLQFPQKELINASDKCKRKAIISNLLSIESIKKSQNYIKHRTRKWQIKLIFNEDCRRWV